MKHIITAVAPRRITNETFYLDSTLLERKADVYIHLQWIYTYDWGAKLKWIQMKVKSTNEDMTQ